MSSIQQLMTDHHKRCDEALVNAENLLAIEDWPCFEEAWQEFVDLSLLHFDLEENLLFPEFEAQTGMTQGPTMVMRQEHAQVKALFEQIAAAASAHDKDKVLGFIESVMILIQQHNMKEEQILYPMTDMRLHNSADIAAQLKDKLQ